jgi:hypothetical protein
VVFNNPWRGRAIENARMLRRLIGPADRREENSMRSFEERRSEGVEKGRSVEGRTGEIRAGEIRAGEEEKQVGEGRAEEGRAEEGMGRSPEAGRRVGGISGFGG